MYISEWSECYFFSEALFSYALIMMGFATVLPTLASYFPIAIIYIIYKKFFPKKWFVFHSLLYSENH